MLHTLLQVTFPIVLETSPSQPLIVSSALQGSSVCTIAEELPLISPGTIFLPAENSKKKLQKLGVFANRSRIISRDLSFGKISPSRLCDEVELRFSLLRFSFSRFSSPTTTQHQQQNLSPTTTRLTEESITKAVYSTPLLSRDLSYRSYHFTRSHVATVDQIGQSFVTKKDLSEGRGCPSWPLHLISSPRMFSK